MITHNPVNERVKMTVFRVSEGSEAVRRASLDSAAKALNRLETYTRFRDFGTFRTEQAVGSSGSSRNR
jgi:hypothetical protein